MRETVYSVSNGKHRVTLHILAHLSRMLLLTETCKVSRVRQWQECKHELHKQRLKIAKDILSWSYNFLHQDKLDCLGTPFWTFLWQFPRLFGKLLFLAIDLLICGESHNLFTIWETLSKNSTHSTSFSSLRFSFKGNNNQRGRSEENMTLWA